MAASHSVLVVDDDASIRMLCRINLELDGHRVREAGDLDAARSVLAAEPVDVVLLDVHVGAGDGRDLLRELRRDRPDLPVAMLSGTADVETVRAADPDGMIPKPFTLEQLKETVERLGGAGRTTGVDSAR